MSRTMANSESDEDLLSDHTPLVYDSQPNAQHPQEDWNHGRVDLEAYQSLRSDGVDAAGKANLNDLNNPSSTTKAIITRPNKFHGPDSTWRGWTYPERSLATSLTQLRNQNLALHLHASHSLKRKLREPERISTAREWNSKQRWQDPGKGEKAQGLDPGRWWTAWPLPPDTVPREWEQWGKPHDEVESSEARLSGLSSRAILEDCLLASALKLAKDRVSTRDYESEEESTAPIGQKQRNREAPIESAATASHPESGPRPRILADDDKALAILRPSFQHILAQLNSILTSLHQARAAQVDPESTFPMARSRDSSFVSNRSRSRSVAAAPKTPQKKENGAESIATTPGTVGPRAPGSNGRPRKYPDRLIGESYYMMRKRLAAAATLLNSPTLTLKKEGEVPQSDEPSVSQERRKSAQHDPDSSSSSDSFVSFSTPDTIQRGRSRSAHLQSRPRIDRDYRLHLRDWSDILSAASLTGVKQDIIRRTANRCSKMFGEDMKFRTLYSDGTAEETFASVPHDIGHGWNSGVGRSNGGPAHGDDEDGDKLRDESGGEDEDESTSESNSDSDSDSDSGSGSESESGSQGSNEESSSGSNSEADSESEEESDTDTDGIRDSKRSRSSSYSSHPIPGDLPVKGIHRDGFLEPIPPLPLISKRATTAPVHGPGTKERRKNVETEQDGGMAID